MIRKGFFIRMGIGMLLLFFALGFGGISQAEPKRTVMIGGKVVVEPRITFRLRDGMVVFFDGNNNKLIGKPAKKMRGPEWKQLWEQKVEARFYQKNPCEIEFEYDNRWYCFKIDPCDSGQVDGPCD